MTNSKTNRPASSATASSPHDALLETLPPSLRKLAESPRVLVRRSGVPASDAKCVVYWMQRAERGVDNPALDCAIEVANELGLPVVAFFSAISNFPRANLRHYAFLNQGLHDAEEDMATRGVPLVVRRPPENKLEQFLHDVGAGIVIGDENPLREPERWRRVLAGRLKIPFWTVDADVVVPSRLFTKGFYAQHLFRRQLDPLLSEYLAEREGAEAREGMVGAYEDRAVATGRRHHARLAALRPEREARGYVSRRRACCDKAASLLRGAAACRLRDGAAEAARSTGRASSRRICTLDTSARCASRSQAKSAVDAGKAPQAAYDAFINELIGWRELAVNFVIHSRATYDSIECAEPWAEKTLREHLRDRREYEYTYEQLARGETHDELWNAAQLQMVRYGWMHNILRMYWGKKILEWSPNPARAFEWAVLLNDTYELDGRDPNSYAGIAWAIAGKFDRPWFEREIFGTDPLHVRRIDGEEVRFAAVHGAGGEPGDGKRAVVLGGNSGAEAGAVRASAKCL